MAIIFSYKSNRLGLLSKTVSEKNLSLRVKAYRTLNLKLPSGDYFILENNDIFRLENNDHLITE